MIRKIDWEIVYQQAIFLLASRGSRSRHHRTNDFKHKLARRIAYRLWDRGVDYGRNTLPMPGEE